MSSFVTCQVIQLDNHPQASKLKIAVVSDGHMKYSVVCGAKNIKLNMVTILAKPGATTNKGLKIQESSIRGVTSMGMLCSPLELGISQEQGIIDLNPKTILGIDYTGLAPSELSSTPWWSFKLLEQIFWDEKNKKMIIFRDNFGKIASHLQILSETYWFGDKFHYRKY